MGFYDLKVTARDGSEVSMKDYENKVVLVVNTATGCGFTPHYKPLEEMYEKYHDRGFEIIDVPCNQFAGQTPGTDDEIHEFCTLKYNTQFPQMKKSDVNGENAIELFKYLKSQKTFEGFGKGPKAVAMSAMLKKIDKDYKNNSEIKWNFTKFIVNRKGEVVARFEPTADMKYVDKFVENLINEVEETMSKYDCLKLENQLCFPLYACAKAVTRHYKPLLDEFDLTYTQYITMMVMWEKKSASVKEIGECLYLDSGTLTPLINKLESKGYIEKHRSDDDARGVVVTITEAGKKLRDKMVKVPNAMGGCVALSVEEAGELYTLLYKILNHFDEIDAE